MCPQKQLSEASFSKAHPWHGISWGESAPKVVNAYVEIVPTDTVKYEIDKLTGHLKVDRPQKYSSQCPTLYGFIPQTYCGKMNGEFCGEKAGRVGVKGDGDPLDICILTEHPITHGDFLVRAVLIGGLRMIDKAQADDKIIAVLENDVAFGHWKNIDDCPERMLERLRHYFLTYKDMPGANPRNAEITHVYDVTEAREVIRLSREDYLADFCHE